MGMLDWFRRLAGSESAPAEPEPQDAADAEIAGLNFMTAIDAHMKWKVRLENYIQGAGEEDLRVEVICRDDQCPLGKWIYGTGGANFGNIDTFGDMKAQHTQFHRCAGRVLAAAQEGRKDEALRMLEHGDYVRASERVKMLLAKLYVQLADRR